MLQEVGEQALGRAARHDAATGVLFLDLDGFKAINDKYGHHAGDIVLIETAQRFNSVIGAQVQRQIDLRGGEQPLWRGTLARVGGDEFVVVLDGLPDPAIAMEVSGALIDALKPPIQLADDPVNVGLSIGIAHSGPVYANAEQLRQDADLAMYEAKSGGHGGVVTFSEALGSERRNRMALENELRDAIREKQFTLF